MNTNALVSLVVAIYKSEKFLPKLLDSICSQTYQNLEVILVDDGSPDNSGAICDKYMKKDTRFQVIHQPNSGTCAARNAGIDRATGDYLLVVDGDDWLEKDYVEYLLGLAISSQSDMSMTDKIFTTIDRKQVDGDSVEIWTPERASAAIIYPEIPIGPWNKMYKMQMVQNHSLRFSVKWSGEGLYFSCMAAQYSNQVCVGHRKIYNYRLNNLNSGLTNYNLEIATNALENINYIKEISLIRTRYMLNAFDWHIWKNNYYVMYLIIATGSLKEENALYQKCLSYIRENLWRAIRNSDITTKEKIHMAVKCYFPKSYARYKLNAKRKTLEKDKME